MKLRLKMIPFVLSLLLLQTAMAEAGTSDDAKAAYTKAKAFFDDGEYEAAAKSFRRAMTLSPSWKIYYNIGHSEAAAKNYGKALEAFQLYIAEAGDELPSDREEEVFNRIEKLKKKTGSVKISAPAGAVVYLDGEKRATAPLPGPVKVVAGKEHTIIIKHQEELLLQRKIRVWAGETTVVEAVLPGDEPADVTETETVGEPTAEPTSEPVNQPADAPPQDTPDDPEIDISQENGLPVIQTVEQKHGLRIAGGILLGVGAAGMLGGGAMGILALVKAKDMDTSCPKNTCDSNEGREDYDNAKKFSLFSTIGLAAGGALATGGLVMIIVGRRAKRKQASTGKLSIAPIVAPDFTGLSVGGKF